MTERRCEMTKGRGEDHLPHSFSIHLSSNRHEVAQAMDGATPNELAALDEVLLAGLARMHDTAYAMGRSLTILEQTTAELRQAVTRLGSGWIGWSRGSTG